MTHVRQQIRQRAKADLAALAGGRVYETRLYPRAVLPAIGVYTLGETSETENVTAPVRRYSRMLELNIEASVVASADADDVLDALVAQIEAALGADQKLNGLAEDSELTGTAVSYTAEGPVMTARLTYRVWYRTLATDPETAL